MDKKAFTGIRIIGIYHKWFAGFFGFLGSLIMIAILSFPEFIPQAIDKMHHQNASALYLKYYYVLAMILSPISFIFGNSLLQLKEIGRKVILYLNIFSLIMFPLISIKGNLNAESSNPLLFGIVIYSTIIYYITRSEVKEQFN